MWQPQLVIVLILLSAYCAGAVAYGRKLWGLYVALGVLVVVIALTLTVVPRG